MKDEVDMCQNYIMLRRRVNEASGASIVMEEEEEEVEKEGCEDNEVCQS